MAVIEKCSCPESEHLRRALEEIMKIRDKAVSVLPESEREARYADALDQICELALAGMQLKSLVGI